MIELPDGHLIRDLTSDSDRRACVRLQRQIWGDAWDELVPSRMLAITLEIGGVAAGAFGPDGELVGFVWGMSGVRKGTGGHWSHMLGVARSARDRGLGRHLKIYQRRQLVSRGIHRMYWTYDPLEARNAHLNFNRLGVDVDEYRLDYYGDGDSSPRFTGLGTDRFIVRWDLLGARATTALGGESPVSFEIYERAPLLVEDRDGEEPTVDLESIGQDRLRIEIPSAIQAIRETGGDLARSWRQATRTAVLAALEAQYVFDCFGRDDSTGRCYYGLHAP